MLSILTGQAKTVEVGRLGCPQGHMALPTYIDCFTKGFEAETLTGQKLPFSQTASKQ